MNWRLDGDKHALDLDIVGPEGRIAMMDCENFEIGDKQLEANAHLIAAAPEMLKALTKAYAHFMLHTEHDCWDDDDDDVMLLMFDAITAAKGCDHVFKPDDVMINVCTKCGLEGN